MICGARLDCERPYEADSVVKLRVKSSVDKWKMVCLKENSPSFTLEIMDAELIAALQEQDPDRGCDR